MGAPGTEGADGIQNNNSTTHHFNEMFCPNELECGDKGNKIISIGLEKNESRTTHSVPLVSEFSDNDVCSWVI